MAKVLILVRHAHRSVEDRRADNGLSEKGKLQREILTEHIEQLLPKGPMKVSLVSSPKKRCLETLEKLASRLNLKIEIEKKLEEGALNRSSLKDFLREMIQSPSDAVVACSHGDVIPSLLEIACGHPLELSKGSLVVLRITEDEEFLLEWLMKPTRRAE
jgi:broad specificity phosphatase PhoE